MNRKQKRTRMIAGVLSIVLIGTMLITMIASYFI